VPLANRDTVLQPPTFVAGGGARFRRLPDFLARRTIGKSEQDERMMRFRQVVLGILLAAGLPGTAARSQDLNDYPTSARADYVFGCMKSNGDTRRALDECSCSIDTIASLLPYDRYVTAEAVLSVGQTQSTLGAQFRSSEPAKAALNDLRRAQAEAEVRCF